MRTITVITSSGKEDVYKGATMKCIFNDTTRVTIVDTNLREPTEYVYFNPEKITITKATAKYKGE